MVPKKSGGVSLVSSIAAGIAASYRGIPPPVWGCVRARLGNCGVRRALSLLVTIMVKTGLAVGLNKGHVLSERVMKPKPSNRKGVSWSLGSAVATG